MKILFLYTITAIIKGRVQEESGLIEAKSIDHAIVLLSTIKSEWEIRDIRPAQSHDIMIQLYKSKIKINRPILSEAMLKNKTIVPPIRTQKIGLLLFLIVMMLVVCYFLDHWRS